MGTPAGATATPRPPRDSSSTATATATAAASWKIEGQEVRRSVAGAKEDAKRMPRTDSFQRYGTLTIQCFDRLSRKPLPGCAVCVSRVVPTATKVKGGGGNPAAAAAAAATPRRMKNAASTFGQATVSDEDVSRVLYPFLRLHSERKSPRHAQMSPFCPLPPPPQTPII